MFKPAKTIVKRLVRTLAHFAKVPVYNPSIEKVIPISNSIVPDVMVVPAGSFVVPTGQNIYDPIVFGVYDLAGEKVIPLGPEPHTLPTNLDICAKAAQHFNRVSQNKLDTSRHTVALTSLEPGTGVCLDACTTYPIEIVKRRIVDLGYKYKPIDIQPAHPDVERQDLQSLTMADCSVARIFSCDTLEHMPDYCKALKEMYRVLKNEGYAVIHMPVYYFDRPQGEPIRAGIDPWDHTRYYSAREVIFAATQVGFVPLRVTYCLDYGSLLVVLGKSNQAHII